MNFISLMTTTAADCLAIYSSRTQIVLNIFHNIWEMIYIFFTSNDARPWDRCIASKISYNGNVSVSREIVIICIRWGGNQRGVLKFFIRGNILHLMTNKNFFFPSMTFSSNSDMPFSFLLKENLQDRIFLLDFCVFTAAVAKNIKKNNNQPWVYIVWLVQFNCVHNWKKLCIRKRMVWLKNIIMWHSVCCSR